VSDAARRGAERFVDQYDRHLIRRVAQALNVTQQVAKNLLAALRSSGELTISKHDSLQRDVAALTGLSRSKARTLLAAIEWDVDYRVVKQTRVVKKTRRAPSPPGKGRKPTKRAAADPYALPGSMRAQLGYVRGNATYAGKGSTKKAGSKSPGRSVRTVSGGLPTLGKGRK
jgi:hypothetical protein